MQVVLQWGTSQQESIAGVQLSEALGNLTLFVLDLVSLVDYDVLPFVLEKLSHTDPDSLKSGQADVELARLEVILEDFFPLGFGGDQVDHSHLWAPLFELFLPVGDDCFGHDDKEVIVHLFEFSQECQK